MKNANKGLTSKELIHFPSNFQDIKLTVLYQSEHYLVVDKPYDLILNSEDENRLSLSTLICKQYPQYVDRDKCLVGYSRES